MTMIGSAFRAFEQAPIPDSITRLAIMALCARTSRSLASVPASATSAFAKAMTAQPIAIHVEAANAQHYEVPAHFFELVLGPRRKYSCCLYGTSDTTLAEAEVAALTETARHARLDNGQAILELGCGWGSLSLWMAEQYPASRIVAVSNSRSQRAYIESQIAIRGLKNLKIVTADVNEFQPANKFDRIVSIEMFEHISNWVGLLARLRTWLNEDGKLFLHVFTHPRASYRFDHTDPADWIGQHFFTGGIMPSHGLIREFRHIFEAEQEWEWSGRHYQRTAEDWLRNFDRNEAPIAELFRSAYGRDARLWQRRWRLFFLATAGLFGYSGGGEWGVSHYLLNPVR